jgi:hypothetical protein
LESDLDSVFASGLAAAFDSVLVSDVLLLSELVSELDAAPLPDAASSLLPDDL